MVESMLLSLTDFFRLYSRVFPIYTHVESFLLRSSIYVRNNSVFTLCNHYMCVCYEIMPCLQFCSISLYESVVLEGLGVFYVVIVLRSLLLNC